MSLSLAATRRLPLSISVRVVSNKHATVGATTLLYNTHRMTASNQLRHRLHAVSRFHTGNRGQQEIMKLPRELRMFRYAEQNAVKQLKEEKETMASRATNLAKEQVAAAAAPAAVKAKKPIMQRVKEEIIHYWHGTKLLGLEIRISSKLTSKLLKGGKLTRREQRQVSSKLRFQMDDYRKNERKKRYTYFEMTKHSCVEPLPTCCVWSPLLCSSLCLSWSFCSLLH